jgi:hypothetical protein
MNSNYKIDLGDDEFVFVPDSIRYQIIQDQLIKSYHWVIGMSMFIIGFLAGLLAS